MFSRGDGMRKEKSGDTALTFFSPPMSPLLAAHFPLLCTAIPPTATVLLLLYSNTVWAFATVGFGLDETYSLNDYIYLRSDDVEGDRQLMSTALDAVARSALHRLHTFRSQELNNLAW
jgi:hypothetical protein